LHRLSTGDVGKTDLRLSAADADRTLQRLVAGLHATRTDPALRSWLGATLRAHASHEATYGEPVRAMRLASLADAWAPPPPDP
jgi:hypothetical protein